MIHMFKQNGLNIVLDTASGAIHNVDDAAYDAIHVYEHEGRDGAYRFVDEKYAELEQEEIEELICEIDELKSSGKLFSDDIYSDVTDSVRNAPLKALCMNVSHICNMKCSYCFAGSGEYGGDDGLMQLTTGMRAIDFLVENSGSRRNLDVDFFGGEPLLNWDVVKGIVDYARNIEELKGKTFRFTLTTNGLLIDDDVIDFANKEIYNVVLSLDGRRDINDASRKLPGGGGSYEYIVPKIKRFVEARSGEGYYIRGTYTRDNLDFVNDVLHIADLGFTELSMEPVVAKPGARYKLDMDDLPVLCGQYELLADEMHRRKAEGKEFSFYHYKLDFLSGPCVYKRIAGCGAGTEYLAVTPGGCLYPCHQFVGNEKFLLGDLWSGITNKKLQDEFMGNSMYSRQDCIDCWARMYCSGGCAANAYNDTGSINGVYKFGCELFKKRIECAIVLQIRNME